MNTNKCQFCGEPIKIQENGNRRYCSEFCYYEAKLLRQYGKRSDTAVILKKKKEAEEILKKLILRYGEGAWFSPKEALELDFSISDGIKLIKGNRAIVIGGYAYIIPDATKMSIYKA